MAKNQSEAFECKGTKDLDQKSQLGILKSVNPSPSKVPNDEGKVYAYGPGLIHGLCGDSANFVISTKGAGAGGLALAVEGPSKADMNYIDNKDGTFNVSYLPTAPGEYKVSARFGGEHIGRFTLVMPPGNII